jgi:hypothetical protein
MPVTCIVVTALWDKGKKLTRPLTIKKVHNRIGDEHFKKVIKHIDKMPVWMQKVSIRYLNMSSDDPELEEDQNEYWQG